MASTRGASRGDSIGTASRAPDAELPPDSKDVDDAVLSKHRIVGAAACTSACTCTRTRAVDSSRPVRGQTVPHAVMHTAIEGFASLQDPVLGPVVTGRASSPEPNAPLARLGPSTRRVHGVSAFATHDQNVQHSARDAFQRGGSSGFGGATEIAYVSPVWEVVVVFFQQSQNLKSHVSTKTKLKVFEKHNGSILETLRQLSPPPKLQGTCSCMYS